jgi:hypothetical protein
MHRIFMSLLRRPVLFLLPLASVLVAVAQRPGIEGLVPPQAEEPRTIVEKDIPEGEKVSTQRLVNRPASAREIILEAHLDDRLANRIDELDRQTGQADGKLSLGDYVMVLNGRELVDFVRGHGYKSFRGPVEIRKWPRGRLQVVVRVTGKDGKTVDAVLESDGSVQGAG